MPLIVREHDALPEWCELRQFVIATLDKCGVRLESKFPRERVVVSVGSVNVTRAGRSQVYGTGQFFDFGRDEVDVRVVSVHDSAQIIRLSGRWDVEMGGCGIFRAEDTATPYDRGDPVPYTKTTSIDSHYHDCDEYWVLLEGRATVVVDGVSTEMTPGDCLCIGMGHQHDMVHAPEPVKALFFETSLQRGKRVGHLWEHTHGPAVPAEGRN